jgi:hypothetical protein
MMFKVSIPYKADGQRQPNYALIYFASSNKAAISQNKDKYGFDWFQFRPP